mgnify:CR=1 FL=1
MRLFFQTKENPQKEAGFTLIELMIVIVIIGILAIYGVPKYQGLQEQYRLEDSAQALLTELKYAKQLAMDQRRTTYVLLHEKEVQVGLYQGGTFQVMDRKSFAQGVTFERSQNYWLSEEKENGERFLGYGISFDYRGFVSGHGIIYLQSKNQRVGINIEAETGYFTLEWP